ncbi:MAG: aldo/keto reductase [Deltaproteobacteria bacterium]|nr:aldo/keto reductase [Deltaproteobacteria bacterium]MBM4299781.1 aldo/keto reductase [Deltaproteobacteria bacterium]
MALISHNQITVPSFMYGTAWKKEATARLVELAVESGFTAIDTANQLIHYQEALVGDALLALAKKGVKRESLFVQTKFTSPDGQGGQEPYDASARITDQVTQSFAISLKHLHTDYLDSYVLHSPYSRRGLDDRDWEVWAAMEALYHAGKTKMIGVSNITAPQLKLLCEQVKVKPMMVQNRCYAQMGWDYHVRQICNAEGIIYQGFSLLTANVQYLRTQEIHDIAGRLGTGPAQVIFRFAMQIGMLPLTGTTSEQHMKEDLAAEKLAPLTAEEMQLVETIAL